MCDSTLNTKMVGITKHPGHPVTFVHFVLFFITHDACWQFNRGRSIPTILCTLSPSVLCCLPLPELPHISILSRNFTEKVLFFPSLQIIAIKLYKYICTILTLTTYSSGLARF